MAKTYHAYKKMSRVKLFIKKVLTFDFRHEIIATNQTETSPRPGYDWETA
jgi:hypothetical protein